MAFINVLSTSLTTGMYIDLKVPAVAEANNYPNGLFPEYREVAVGGTKRVPIRGFVSENEGIGTIEVVDYDNISARYLHNKPYPNRILFFSINDANIYTVSIIAIPIHDHSSISQGGPAYGTYYTDYRPAPEGENP